MTLAQHLRALYPNADRSQDYIIRDDGAGQYIYHWDIEVLGPRPDAANLPPAPAPVPPDPLGTWDVVTLKIAFNQQNEIRALQGKAPVTVTQFKTAVRAIL